MVRTSIGCALNAAWNQWCCKQSFRQCSSGDDSDPDNKCTQLVAPGTCTISDGNSVNEGSKQWTVTHDVAIGWASIKFALYHISILSAVQETFCGIHNLQFDISTLDIVAISENIWHSWRFKKLLVLFLFHSTIRKWKNVTVDEMYVVLAVFICCWAQYKRQHLRHAIQRTACCSLHSYWTPYHCKGWN
jgi:hypothetical protein